MVIPGIQGRWEWMRPAVSALGRRHPVLTFSLGAVQAPHLFEKWAEHIDRLLDTNRLERAAVVGVSFGGLVAVWYAAVRPHRVSGLVIVATPSPRWTIDAQSARYARRPVLSTPLFALRAVRRLTPELISVMPGLGDRIRFGLGYAARAVRYPASPRHMAAIVQEWSGTDLISAAARVTAPTLVITGEDNLDLVVPVASTLEYLDLIPGSVHARLNGTGHIGLLSKPAEFAKLVSDFLDASRHHRAGRDA